MEKKIFGTDGIRGDANQYPLVPDLIMRLAVSVGHIFKQRVGKKRPTVIIGKDTRLSGYMIEPALTSGLTACGIDVVLVGPMPTSAISMLVSSMRADFGIMISASHNPFHDNGIKILDHRGYKLSDETELEIENLLNQDYQQLLVSTIDMGRANRLYDVQGRYVEFAKNTFNRKLRLNGLNIVVDSANGAAYKVSEEILWELGANVYPINNKPDGFNINKECGATYPSALVAAGKRAKG